MSRLLTVAEAAERLRLSVSTLYHLTSAREIPFIKIGQRVLFEERELAEWVAAHRVDPLAG